MSQLFSAFRIFKSPQHKEFTFPTRYYDERVERLENIQAEAERESGSKMKSEQVVREHQLRERITDAWVRQDYALTQKKSTIRFLIILGILSAILYFIYVNVDNIVA